MEDRGEGARPATQERPGPGTVASVANRLFQVHQGIDRKLASEEQAKTDPAVIERTSQQRRNIALERKILAMVQQRVAERKVDEAKSSGKLDAQQERELYARSLQEASALEASDTLEQEFIGGNEGWEATVQRFPNAVTSEYNKSLYTYGDWPNQPYADAVRELKTPVADLLKAGKGLN